MIATSILFILPQSTNWQELRNIAKDRAKNFYQNLPGLHTKAFVLNEETGEYGGLYIWENKESLDAFLNSPLFQSSKDKFGTPEIKIFDLVAHIEQGELKE
jgi:heme-degrading monooxygenase HmoA